MCEAYGCETNTPGGGYCVQCAVEQKWEQDDQLPHNEDSSPDCTNCNQEVEEVHYKPDRPGVIICEDCYRELNKSRDLMADGGFRYPAINIDELREVLAYEQGEHFAIKSTTNPRAWISAVHAVDLEVAR